MVRALDFYPGGPGSNPTIGGNFFSYASVFCYDFHVIRLVIFHIILAELWPFFDFFVGVLEFLLMC